MTIDINCDMGESFGVYTIGADEVVLPYITSANIACGFHGGDPLVMAKTVAMCRERGIAVGAHPGFPDLAGFGRRNMALSPEEVGACVQYQLGALSAFCRAQGVRLRHVKPHGALYNMAAADSALARAICKAIYAVDSTLLLYGLSGSRLIQAAEDIGLPCASEVFADRAYEEDGSLRPRSLPGAMIASETEAVARVIRMATEGRVAAWNGTDIAIRADTVCIHGDSPSAPAFARTIREALAAANVSVASPA